MLSKYFHIIKIAIQDGLTYRINVYLWRIRNVINFLSMYLFWQAVFLNSSQVFNYNKKAIMTYVFINGLLWPIIFATRTADIGGEIASGSLGNYLIKPFSYFKNWIARDIADKCINTMFGFIEITVLFLILKPNIIWPQPVQLFIFLFIIIFSMSLFFLLNYLVSLTTFWFREMNGWPVRFLFFTFSSIMTGSLFPLDMFPQAIYRILLFLPTTYISFIPIQVWMGKIYDLQIIGVLLFMIFWIFILYFLIKLSWKKGIKMYESEGR